MTKSTIQFKRQDQHHRHLSRTCSLLRRVKTLVAQSRRPSLRQKHSRNSHPGEKTISVRWMEATTGRHMMCVTPKEQKVRGFHTLRRTVQTNETCPIVTEAKPNLHAERNKITLPVNLPETILQGFEMVQL